MKRYRIFVVALITLTYFVDAENSQDANKCIFGNDSKENARLKNKIPCLVGRIDYVGRCDSEVEESWTTILRNFEANDRDVALLRTYTKDPSALCINL